jgi:hypothetical protein
MRKLQFSALAILFWCTLAAAQEHVPAPVTAPYAGATISDFKGKLSIELPNRGATTPVRGAVLPPETTINTDDGRMVLKLADGSDVMVRPHTKLVLKNPESSGWKYLQLLLGRVHAEIQKRLGGTPGFQIGTPSAVISVRGTRFDVEVNQHGITEVDVEEGVVELDGLSGRGESVMITAGMSSRVGMESAPERPTPTHDMRPELDRPNHRHDRDSGGDDDAIKKLEARDREHHEGDHRGGDSDGEPSGSSGSGDSHSGSGSGSSDGGSSGGTSGSDSGDGDHHDSHGGSKPPDFF